MNTLEYLYPNPYYYNLCNLCRKNDKDVKRCSNCKTVAYCSKKHQIEDWSKHKLLCKAISITEANIMYKIENFKDFRVLQNYRQVSWQKILNRPLKMFENQMWMFPRVCALCYSNHVLSDWDCNNCMNASYCSEEHKVQHEEQHKKHCAALKLCMQLDTLSYDSTKLDKDIYVCDLQNNIKCLPINLDELMQYYEKKYKGASIIQKLFKSDIIAPAATLLYGLEKAGLVENRVCRKTNLTVHVVGAGLREMAKFLWKDVSEFPFHWITNLDSLDYIIIGPELEYDDRVDKFTAMLCQSCKNKNVRTSCTFSTQLYHNVVNVIDSPDVVVIFNSGIHEFHGIEQDPWKNSISCLTKTSGVPLVLTAYTLVEILKDVEIITNNNSVRVISEPHRNPFSNMIPIRDFDTEGIPVFYNNAYVAVLTR